MQWRLAIVLLILLTSCHVGRFVVYNFANHTDYRKFPDVEITSSQNIFHFPAAKQRLKIDPEGDSETFEDFLSSHKTISFLVIHRDSLVYEWYGNRFNDSSVVTTFSMAKSFVGLLIGIAIEEGKIGSVDDPVSKYHPDLTGSEFEGVTIRHALNMATGLKFNESYYNPFGHVAKFYYGRNLNKYVARLDREVTPGSRFKYQSCDTQILGMVLEGSTGKRLSDYFREKLWEPLGMEFDASWSIDSRKHDTEKAFCCLNARTIDLAKVGRLMLQNGSWEGNQIVPSDWVIKSTSPSVISDRYSNQWWLFGRADGDFMAQGILGQYLYINPAKDLIIVRMGKNYGKFYWAQLFFKIAGSIRS